MSPSGRPAVVVFDLDGTLVAGDSFGGFLRRLLTRQPLRLAAALLTAPVWLPALATGRLRVPAERWLVWLAAVGLDAEGFTAAARAFAAEHAGPAGGRTAAAAVARVREHVARGDRVVVATACARPLAAEVCRVIGLPDVEVVDTDLRRSRWGLPAPAVPARGQGKLEALRAAGVPLPLDHAYSDSASDLPLLRAARVPHLVDPTPRDLARLRAVLGPDVEVLRWAGSAG
ncbi:haloacid dehalogenase-like hydrolase [Geodermatophilus nigrescens]|uniref:Phosphatidylglycerophosphatase C n=1 Tax=Geodermatophilus nigrescens TaxID=1070870 RepID=A0A1M5MYQ0_9ACTN|nr:haloacid dehalogenase-like hydrolase [Geodermatophilus nigrescens]SHG82460.1 phosphatidylglycerophosphatase C [Geodermatophilus nigrescens]